MAGPWEKYQQAEQGPWTKYAAQPEPQAGSPSNPRRYTNPNRGKSSLELAGRGSFKFLNDVSLARRQMMTDVAGLFGADVADEKNRLEGIADARKLDPVMNTTAGQIGYGATAAVPAVVASMAAPGYGGAALGGAGLGLFQPTGTGESRTVNTAISTGASLAGQGVFNAIGRVAQPVKSTLNKAEQRAVQLLKDKGVSLSVGQQTGSRAAQAVERTLADNPASSGAMAQQGEKFSRSFTRATLRTVGENADTAAPEVLERASTRIGQVFDDIASRYDLDLGPVGAKLATLEKRAGDELLNDGRIATQIQAIRDAAQGGKLSGKAYQNVKTTLDNLSRQQNIGPYAAELRQILDDALMAATKGTKDYARLVTARSQYRNLMAIADSADTTANGLVSPAKLAQRLKSGKYTRNSMRFGRGDAELARLARAGSTVVDRFPNSGTAARAAQQVAIPAAAGAAGYALSGDPETAAKIAAATWVIPKAGGWLATNPGVQNYLASGLGQGLVRNALAFPSRAGLGAAVPAYLLSQE